MCTSIKMTYLRSHIILTISAQKVVAPRNSQAESFTWTFTENCHHERALKQAHTAMPQPSPTQALLKPQTHLQELRNMRA